MYNLCGSATACSYLKHLSAQDDYCLKLHSQPTPVTWFNFDNTLVFWHLLSSTHAATRLYFSQPAPPGNKTGGKKLGADTTRRADLAEGIVSVPRIILLGAWLDISLLVGGGKQLPLPHLLCFLPLFITLINYLYLNQWVFSPLHLFCWVTDSEQAALWSAAAGQGQPLTRTEGSVCIGICSHTSRRAPQRSKIVLLEQPT